MLSFLLASAAWSCSCAGIDVPDAYDKADAVFSGTWTEEAPAECGEIGMVHLEVVLDEVWKGNPEDLPVVTSASGASCGVEAPDSGVLFANKWSCDGVEVLSLSLCSQPHGDDLEDQLDAMATPRAPTADTDPAAPSEGAEDDDGPGQGCGCAQGPNPANGALVLLSLAAIRRRSRPARSR